MADHLERAQALELFWEPKETAECQKNRPTQLLASCICIGGSETKSLLV